MVNTDAPQLKLLLIFDNSVRWGLRCPLLRAFSKRLQTPFCLGANTCAVVKSVNIG